MNILFIHQSFPAQFRFLAPALAGMAANRVVAMTPKAKRAYNWLGVQVIPYESPRQISRGGHPWLADFDSKIMRGEACFLAARNLKLQGFSPDLIIAHPGWGESMFLKEVWPRARLGIYCEYFYRADGSEHGFDPEFPIKDESLEGCQIRLKNLSNLLHFLEADAGISPTIWQARSFPSEFQGKISVIHDGIDTRIVAPANEATLKLTPSTTVSKTDEIITFVSRTLEPCRGFHVFMRALPEILRARKNAKVIIVGGNGPGYGPPPKQGTSWRDVLSAEIRAEMPATDWQRIHFLGPIPYQQFVSLLQISSAHVYLTYPFVLSWSLLEAMSAGCAIVASNTPPLEEVLEDGVTGLLFDFFDTKSLGSQICKVLSNRNMQQQLGHAAREHIQRHYDLHTICLPKQLAWVDTLSRT